MKRNKLVAIGVMLVAISLVAPLLIAPQTATAFPGDREDEHCEQLVEEALLALDAGQEVAEPDCINALGMTAMQMRAARAQMALYPAPNIRQIPVNEEILYQRRYRRVVGDVEIYDAPNGNVVSTIAQGYNFVTIGAVLDGWVQIGTDQWVRSEVVQDADVSPLSGVEIIGGTLERPFAWIVSTDRPRPSRFPGGPQYEGYERLAHYQIVTIYGTEVVDGYEWYLIGPDQWIQQIRVAKVKPVQRPADVGPDEHWVAIDLFEQTAVAYEGDQMVFATLISSGLPQWSTNQGLFKIYQRWTAARMTGATGQPDFYFIERVPWVMYFDGDIGLHGTYWHDRFGYRQSHGCVNLSIQDAWWIYRWTEQAPNGEAWVYVYSSGEYRSDLPAWARRPRN